MNIVVVTPSWPQRKDPNGIVTYYTNLIPALIALGHQVHIVTFHSSDTSDNVHVIDYSLSVAEKLWYRFKNYLSSGYDQYFLGSRGIARTISKIHEKHPVDIVQMEDSFGWHYYVQQQFSFPIIMRLHGPYFLNSFEKALSSKTQYRIKLEERAFLAARFITSPSKNVLDLTQEKYGAHWLASKAIANSMAVFDEAHRWHYASIKEKQLLFVGRFDNHKGGDVMLHAFFEARKALPGLELVFIGPDRGFEGEGERLSIEQFLAKYGYDRDEEGMASLSFLGRQDKQTINGFRASAHLTVVSSRYETFGNVALEALACGSPLVCSNSGALPEIVLDEETGLLFDSEDSNQLAQQIQRLINSEELAQTLSHGALARAKATYSPEASAAETIAFFEKVMGLYRGE